MNRNLAVGTFALLGLALFATGLFLIGDRHQAFQKHLTLYTEFADISGLAKGSKVQVGGMDAGRIEEIVIPDSPSSKFRVKFRIDEKFQGLVRSDSTASITTAGIVGDTFLSIGPGSVISPVAKPETTLDSKEPIELSELVSQAKGALGDVDAAVKNANGLLTSVGGNLNTALTGARGTLGDVDDVVAGLKRGDGTAGMLLRDPALASTFRQTLTNAEQATDSLRSAAQQTNSLVSDMSSRNIPQKIDDTLVSVRDAASNLDTASVGVRQTVADATAPDDRGLTAGVNLRETISNVRTATGNIAEDSEALKHHFLIRGFFRKRGYYTLSAISPAAYRRDPFTVSKENDRTWLSASQLFDRNSKGVEELSAAGKEAIDQALGKYGEAVLSEPLVVEGYASGGSTVEKMEFSHERAFAVRNYLQARFHLDSKSIGAVGLDDQPPKGSGYATWDGVTIVLFRKSH